MNSYEKLRVLDLFSGIGGRLKCLGNAVVPHIPWLIGNMILESYDD